MPISLQNRCSAGSIEKPRRLENIAYAIFVLFCFWAGAQSLNLLVHALGIYEHLMQVQDTGRPRVEIGLGVGRFLARALPSRAASFSRRVIAAFYAGVTVTTNPARAGEVSQREIYRPIHRARRSSTSHLANCAVVSLRVIRTFQLNTGQHLPRKRLYLFWPRPVIDFL